MISPFQRLNHIVLVINYRKIKRLCGYVFLNIPIKYDDLIRIITFNSVWISHVVKLICA